MIGMLYHFYAVFLFILAQKVGLFGYFGFLFQNLAYLFLVLVCVLGKIFFWFISGAWDAGVVMRNDINEEKWQRKDTKMINV